MKRYHYIRRRIAAYYRVIRRYNYLIRKYRARRHWRYRRRLAHAKRRYYIAIRNLRNYNRRVLAAYRKYRKMWYHARRMMAIRLR